MMIDTGAGSTVFDVDGAKGVGITIGPFNKTIYGIGGPAPAAPIDVKSIQLGTALLENRKYLAADLFKNFPTQTKDHGAILGADIMRELDAVISYKEQRIFLKPVP